MFFVFLSLPLLLKLANVLFYAWYDVWKYIGIVFLSFHRSIHNYFQFMCKLFGVYTRKHSTFSLSLLLRWLKIRAAKQWIRFYCCIFKSHFLFRSVTIITHTTIKMKRWDSGLILWLFFSHQFFLIFSSLLMIFTHLCLHCNGHKSTQTQR